VYLEGRWGGGGGGRRKLRKRKKGVWRSETTMYSSFPLILIEHSGSTAIKSLAWWHASLFGQYIKWTIHLHSPPPHTHTHNLNNILRVDPPSPFATLLLLATMQRTKDEGRYSLCSLLLASCQTERHFQLSEDCCCSYCRAGSLAALFNSGQLARISAQLCRDVCPWSFNDYLWTADFMYRRETINTLTCLVG
jgi:hypothetical protein